MPAIQTYRIAPGLLLTQAATDIVARHTGTDGGAALRDTVLLLPDAHAVSDTARALSVAERARQSGAAAGASPLLLPRITTLRLWASAVAIERPLQPRAAREAVLYAALGGHAALGDADRWALCGELAALFDELTRHSARLPADVQDFIGLVEQAYRLRRSRSLDFEATLVHELWRLTTRDVRALDGESAYLLRLQALAERAALPLYVLDPRRLTAAESLFLEAYAARAPVTMFVADGGDAAGDAIGRTLAAAWPAGSVPALRERALALRAAVPQSALAGRVSLFGAADAESEARAVDVQVRDWLLAGCKRIAVIVLDRLTARRARALLERAEVLVRDESGWPMATTSAATVLARWLDVVAGDAWHRDLLDLMKSPFAFHDWPRDQRRQAVWRLEQAVRRHSVLSGIGQFIALAEDDAEVRQLLARVQRALRAAPEAAAAGTVSGWRTRRPLVQWLDTLLTSLAEIGVIAGWRADSAGEQLLALLEGLRSDLAGHALPVPFAEWRRWLTRQLESASFIEDAVTSPVVFTHLAATPLRAFDAALVLGCDARHLAAADMPVFFNQGVRAQLGLPTRDIEARDGEGLLARLLAATPRVMLTWQTHADAEENLLAPALERLLALHRLAYGDKAGANGAGSDLAETRLAGLLAAPPLRCADTLPLPALSAPPAPPAAQALLPRSVSASAYNTLMACPYQFHARYLLRLLPADEVEERIDKSGYGRHVHDILTQFHAAHACVTAMPEGAAAAHLASLSAAVFAGVTTRDPLARGWLLRWLSLIPAYLQWQMAREAEGWRWHAGEIARELTIHTPAGHTFRLLGRLDRVDLREDGKAAVLDYKMRPPAALKQGLAAAGEDVQLPVYVLLWQQGRPGQQEQHGVASAGYVAVDKDEVGIVPLPGEAADLAHTAETARAHLAGLMDGMHGGQALRAQGAPQACAYCEMDGLCRRLHWE